MIASAIAEATVLHTDLDAFYASVEQRDAPGLRSRRVIVRGVVLPVSALLAQQNSTYSANWNSLMALAVLTSLQLQIVSAFTQRRLINDLSLDAVT